MHRIAKYRASIVRWRRQLCTKDNKLVTAEANVVEEKGFDVSAHFMPMITFQRAIRVVRVVFVSWSLYSVGYISGMVKFAEDPMEVVDRMLKVDLRVDNKSSVDDQIYPADSEMQQRVNSVGGKILASARDLCAQRLKYAQYLVAEAAEAKEAEILAVEVTKWQSACRRLEGDWKFTVCRSNQLETFVLDYCPRRIFIRDGMIQSLHMTDEELAIAIGNEMGHIILGHNENKALFSAALLILQLMLMACVDPVITELLGYDLFLAQLQAFIIAGYSREEDCDADKVGLILASLSCFDMIRAINLYSKKHFIEGRRKFRATDMHPQSYRRLEALQQLAKVHEEERKTYVMFGKYRRDCVEQQVSWIASYLSSPSTTSAAPSVAQDNRA
jgi:hypothetical protein